MAYPGRANGPGSQPYGYQGQANGLSSRAIRSWRAPTVHDALPFTPLASIVPFNPEVIPPPYALPSSTSSISTQTPEEDRQSRKLLEELSAGANSAERASKRCQQTIRDVQKLLDPDSLTQFKFKTPKQRNHDARKANTQSSRPSLGSFANMVLDNTAVSYRYLTPESVDELQLPTSQATHGVNGSKIPAGQIKLEPLEAENGIAAATPVSQPSQVHHLQAVVIPTPVSPAQRAQYQYVADSETIGVANPSNRPTPTGTRALSVDQRKKADVAVNHLQHLLQEIFEAEDQLQPDTSGRVSNHAYTYFLGHDTENGQGALLQPTAQAQLESAITKVATYGRLVTLPVDLLARAQKLCENTITVTDNLSLHIGEDWTEQDTEAWLQQVASADNSLCACRTLLKIMTAGPREKELQSEDHLREVLSALKVIAETCIIPIVEQRANEKVKGERIKGDKSKSEGSQDAKFLIAAANRTVLQSLLYALRKSVRVLGDLMVKTEVDESSVSSAEFLCKSLIFAENGSTEKEAALGIQSFEELRRSAMGVLASIFTRYPEQRHFILDEILMSLEKLPPTRQNARQYKLVDAKPIQLVSALLMRLVQTSACKTRVSPDKLRDDEDAEEASVDIDSEDEDASGEDDDDVIKPSPTKKHKVGNANDLASIARPLHVAAQSHASYIIKVLIQRALSTSKASEEPYRKILDIFTEDFINVLGSAEWPAAEMLLFTLLSHMVNLIDNPKTPVPSKTLALELLGTMGSGILELRMTTRRASRSLDTEDSDLAARMVRIVDQIESDNIDVAATLAFNGPHRIVLEYLQTKEGEAAQTQSAFGYQLMQWAYQLSSDRESYGDDVPGYIKSIQGRVRSIFLDPCWLRDNSDFEPITAPQGRLAALAVTLTSRFCQAFNRILQVLLSSMNSDQSRIKSRSLKSIFTLLEQDPSVLDRNHYILTHIYRRATDPSPLVRDSALDLIARCINLRPALDQEVSEKVIARAHDAAVGVRKRAMKLLRDIYLRNKSDTMRAAIADAVLSRMHDSEESVMELARTTMEEIWFSPLQTVKLEGSGSVEAKLQYQSQAALLVKTVDRDEQVAGVLESLIAELLTKSKAAAANLRVCEGLVRVLFDGIIDNSEIPGSPPQATILQTLAILARTSPLLFTASQLERLEPYTQNLTKTDDLIVYSSVVTILRHVIPHLDTLRPDFLEKIQIALQASVTKLPKAELAEVAPCLWTVTCLRKNFDRPMTLVISVLTNVDGSRKVDLNGDSQKASRIIRLLNIAGQFGKACDFGERLAVFKSKFSWFKGNSVPGLMVEILCSFASPKQPLEVREAAVENICAIAQAWPKQFLRSDVLNAFETVFKDRIPQLDFALLEGLAGFLCSLESPNPEDAAPALGGGVQTGAERIGKTYVATDSDGASTSLAQRFLQQILRLALATTDQTALTATRLITTIARQGMTHPKESGPALVALETSPNSSISKLAFLEHRSMNSRFETMFDKEYMRAVQQAFNYQRHVVGSTRGFAGQPPAAKMHLLWEVLKAGKAQVRKKFLGNICQKLSFDPAVIKQSSSQPEHLTFTQFCVENLAFLDFDRTDEALLVLSALEKVFAGVGTSVAQAIENDVLKMNIESITNPLAPTTGDFQATIAEATGPTIEPSRLHQLAISAQVLTLIWETRSFIRRYWTLQKAAAKTKKPTKDQESSRAPTKAPNWAALAESYLGRMDEIMAIQDSPDRQKEVCAQFVALFSTDNEVKVGSADEDDDVDTALAEGYDTFNEAAGRKSPSLPAYGDRKRKSISVSSTPRKKGRPNTPRRGSGPTKYDDEHDSEEDDFM